MIYGADFFFFLPIKPDMTSIDVCRFYFGNKGGWVLTTDFTTKRNIICVFKDKLNEQGKEGLMLAKLSWEQCNKPVIAQ